MRPLRVAMFGPSLDVRGGMSSVTRLMIDRGGRTTINVHAEGNSMLTEDEREVRDRDNDDRQRDWLCPACSQRKRQGRDLRGGRRARHPGGGPPRWPGT